MPSTSEPNEAEFAEAALNWKLEKLYADLASVKGKRLTPVEKQYLRALLCSYSPNEIAAKLRVSSDTVRTSLSKGLYRYIEELLIRQARNTLRVKDWSRVAPLLEQAGYKSQNSLPESMPESIESSHLRRNCEGLPDVSIFYGRQEELATLQEWILQDGCRLIALLGLGGIGKTALAAKLVGQIQAEFEYVVWRSLRSVPSVQEFVTTLLQAFSHQPDWEGSATVDVQLSRLMEVLHRHRCLLILEDVQMVLSRGELAGQYQVSYEGYGELLRRIGEEAHQSCLVLTSWEMPMGVSLLEGQTRPVRTLKLEGLNEAPAKAILAEKGLSEAQLWEELIRPYRGNPLALKIVATFIQDVFGGSVAEFLNQNTLFLGDFTYLLYQQFSRLSESEQKIICWLASEGKPVSLSQLGQGIGSLAPRSELLKALQSLGRRSLIEQVKVGSETLFTLQPVVIKYALNQASYY
ncbi:MULTISPECIES: NB-ARC domain-containing protein [unclassified Coleofasciculus]|uniref:NB-ARC domain-containing protein n=1 Tax=unclassified Coleofasciculus TaxID=2692782 RepID=UPI00187EDFEA|nr:MULTISPECIES: NB-ARC domain-containing protein [unclassified Coleofasciculus]MBE9129245.1 hypothetical protein [Coleofasciculus sp. LEGE 07081]MBE9151903.1 hypothetical protein [Coleofasciculus sp. LEGE 07092]